MAKTKSKTKEVKVEKKYKYEITKTNGDVMERTEGQINKNKIKKFESQGFKVKKVEIK